MTSASLKILRRTWYSMKARCKSHPDYAGRGIKVCDAWMKSFAAFAEHMGPRPHGHSIDRIDTNGNYEPGNCRWATRSQQMRNTRAEFKLEFHGKLVNGTEWAEVMGFDKGWVYERVKTLGLTGEQFIAERWRTRTMTLARLEKKKLLHPDKSSLAKSVESE